ncbi:esterase [Paracoccus aestuarii]|uniref:Esterase n=1 Tax=Paracoccus aestuarii TaxID=453842 RepID=A0A419A134_9RHOB|nr:PHB depolymerase family esterase [Paracoccus aestuarii]RJL06614.1 esterase [Paracoccus aestuarii]WCR00871.1 PHB depolymerase family esterase [Paracoccus aestuarii]
MTKPMSMNMSEITRLMRAGQLTEATRMIQTGLGGSSLPQMPQMPQMGQMPQMPHQGRATPAIPEGARWTMGQHAAAGQARQYRLYVPASAADGAEGLLLLLHGCTQDPDDFARGTAILAAAEARRMIVVLPAQTAQSNMNKCWNWFEPRHAATDGGEAAFLTDLTRTLAHDHAIAPDRRFAAGLSAGGAMAVILGAVFADDFGAVACHSGLPNGAASDMGSAFAAMSQGGRDGGAGVGCRLLILHGSADGTVSPRNADAVLSQALRRQPGLTRRAADARLAGHEVRIGRHRDATGTLRIEDWRIAGLGHAWSGGAPEGSHTAPGPSATDAMMRFFLDGAD